MNIAVIIPTLNEEQALPLVLADLQKALSHRPYVNSFQLIVADNGSTDRTAECARAGGAQVTMAPRRGYGSACLAGLAVVPESTDVVVFSDGDHSIFADDIDLLLQPLVENRADLVLGARVPVQAGALTAAQRWGNALACLGMRWMYGHRFEDLGPFRAIRRPSLLALQMQDPAFGWTIEMQIKALRQGLRIAEVPVRYRARVGQSKISGTFWGSVKAGKAILSTLVKYAYANRS